MRCHTQGTYNNEWTDPVTLILKNSRLGLLTGLATEVFWKKVKL